MRSRDRLVCRAELLTLPRGASVHFTPSVAHTSTHRGFIERETWTSLSIMGHKYQSEVIYDVISIRLRSAVKNERAMQSGGIHTERKRI